MEFLLAGEFEMDLLLLLGKHTVSKIVRVHKLLKKIRLAGCIGQEQLDAFHLRSGQTMKRGWPSLATTNLIIINGPTTVAKEIKQIGSREWRNSGQPGNQEK
jgi:ABC-type uncharacterized transport system auxiliary subunit